MKQKSIITVLDSLCKLPKWLSPFRACEGGHPLQSPVERTTFLEAEGK